jgi:hypothetical protein
MSVSQGGRRVGFSAVVATVALLAGCGGTGESGTNPSPSSPEPSPSPPSSSAQPAPGALAPIRYARSGGLAGMSDVLVVSPDGTVSLTSRRPQLHRTGRLTAAERAALVAAIPSARAATPRAPGDPHPDGFMYTVTLDTVEFRFTGAGAPPELAGLVVALRRISGRLGRTV